MVAKIFKGYTLTVNGSRYTVQGSRQLRGTQFYIVADANGRQGSMRRNDVLAGQQDGTISVSL